MHISVLSRHRYFEFFFLELLFEVLEMMKQDREYCILIQMIISLHYNILDFLEREST